MKMEVSLRQITYFLRLVERGSFTAAAESLGITQPALSIAISQLERALEAALLRRGASPLTLTDEGEIFIRYAQRVQRDLVEARDELAAFGSGTIGRLEICMGLSAAVPEVGAALTSMSVDFPGLDVAVGLGVAPAVLERLHDGEYSLYVGTVPDDLDDERFEVTRLDDLRLAVLAGAGHPLAARRKVSAADLAKAAWIAIGNIEANVPEWPRMFLEAGLAPPRPAINVRNIALVRSLLTENHFVTILPLSMARADLEHGILVQIGADRFGWTIPLSLVTRQGRPLPAAARIFADRLRQQFELEQLQS